MGAVGWFLTGLVVFFNQIQSFFRQTKSLHTARFATLSELRVLLTSQLDENASLFLGVSRFNQLLRVSQQPTRRELGNMLIVAPTRGGKGLLAVSQLLSFPHSVVVNDIKGELFDQTAGYRRSIGKVVVFDPTGIGHRFDPLAGRESEDELLSVATHVLYQPDETDGAIFTQRAIGMLTQVFLAARIEGVSALPYVRSLTRLGVQETAARLNSLHPDLATQLLDVPYAEANFQDRFLLSSWGTLTARLRPLLTETVIRSLANSDFTPADLMTGKTPTTIYLRWPEQDLLALSPLVRLIWGSLIDSLITTYDRAKGANCQPVLLLIDEAGRTAIPSLADHATTVVGRGITLWVAVQSLSQLDVVYGRRRATVLRATWKRNSTIDQMTKKQQNTWSAA